MDMFKLEDQPWSTIVNQVLPGLTNQSALSKTAEIQKARNIPNNLTISWICNQIFHDAITVHLEVLFGNALLQRHTKDASDKRKLPDGYFFQNNWFIILKSSQLQNKLIPLQRLPDFLPRKLPNPHQKMKFTWPQRK